MAEQMSRTKLTGPSKINPSKHTHSRCMCDCASPVIRHGVKIYCSEESFFVISLSSFLFLSASSYIWKKKVQNLIFCQCLWKHFHAHFLKGTMSQDFLFLVFFMNQFPQAPDYIIRAVSNFSILRSRFATGVNDRWQMEKIFKQKFFLWFHLDTFG